MKSLIFGYGITGQSFERYLAKKGKVFEIYDENVKGPNIFNILPDQAQLSSYEMIYLSPGINLQKLYTKEEFNKISYVTDLDIFFKKIVHTRLELQAQTEKALAVINCISF